MARFSVVVPFDPVVQEALDSRVFTNIADADLAAGIRIRRDGDGYTAQLEIQADRPWRRPTGPGIPCLLA